MMFGMSPATFLIVHVAISLIALVSGLVVMVGLLRGERLPGWTALFLLTAVLTSVTGFGFPFDHFLPSHWTGVISLVVLAVALLALYVFRLSGSWRWLYVVAAMMALYLDAFVTVVQAFQKIAPLHALAPTESEPPFAIAQGLVLLLFFVVTIVAVRRFNPVTASES
jgi:hypothetical protein